MTDIQSMIVLPSAYAKEKGTTPQTVMTWIEKAELKPAYSEGRTKLFMRAELDDAADKYGKGSKAGYIHPDQYKAVEDHRDRLIMVTIERDAEIERLKAIINTLQSEYDATVDKQDELMDKAERAINERLYGKAVTDEEMDELMEEQDEVLASSGEDELLAVMAE